MLIPSFLIICSFIASFTAIHALPSPRGYLINCGSTEEVEIDKLKYVGDKAYINTGNTSRIKRPNTLPLVSTLRFFPDKWARRYCYSLSAVKGSKYLVRTTYYYGGFDGGTTPPVFDQFVDGALWSSVNTIDDYAAGRSSYYELVVATQANNLSICLARNKDTSPDSSPFISVLEVMLLDDLVYKPVDFTKYILTTVARHTFGVQPHLLSFPDDNFNRFWQPYNDTNPIVESKANVTPSDFWNIPPANVFNSAITTSRGKSLQLDWPSPPLPPGNYYLALYFQDNRSPSPFSWRVFNVTLNGDLFYSNLNVSTKGVSVYANQWPLSGPTRFLLTPAQGAPVGPLMNAAEMLQMLPAAAITNPRDVLVLQDLLKSMSTMPSDWVGDPCLPQRYSWTGLTCSQGPLLLSNITTLNLTGMGIVGSLPSSITNLSDITNLYLANNKLTGRIPDLGLMTSLEALHLENNQFEGEVPQSLGLLPEIKEIYLQGNKLDPVLPGNLRDRKGVDIRI